MVKVFFVSPFMDTLLSSDDLQTPAVSSSTDEQSPTSLADTNDETQVAVEAAASHDELAGVASHTVVESCDAAVAVTSTKAGRAPACKRPRETSKRHHQVEVDTAEADRRAAFRHAQKLLRKSAATVDLKSALQRSFASAASQSQPPLTDMSDAGIAAATTPTSSLVSPVAVDGVKSSFSVHDITQRFLSKVNEKKQHTIQALVRRELSSPLVLGGGNLAATRRVDEEDIQLTIMPSGSATSPTKVTTVSQHVTQAARLAAVAASGGSLTTIKRTLSVVPLVSVLEDSMRSAQHTQNSPPMAASTTSPSTLAADLAGNETESEGIIFDDASLVSALQRKHELLRFKKEQQHRQLTSTQNSGASGEAAVATAVGAAATPRQQPLQLPQQNSSLMRHKSLQCAFHMSETDVSFLKRTNSFDNSVSQHSMVFRKDTNTSQSQIPR